MVIRYSYLVIGLMIVISVLSNIPDLVFFNKNISPELRVWIKQHTIKWGTTGFFSYSISPHPDYILHKLGHIVLFGFLGIALYWAMNRSVPKAVMVITIFALIDEFHQGFTLGRSSRFGDVVLDVTAAVGFILIASKRQPKTGKAD
ncbi:VanZ family protein [Sporomusa malonica]|uniref:VanZ like family protein n=1 Tax=Sporomusa malonica TaxID=112901 RepID=A0A1W1YU15_9FIRM|nr:VanZ family protein [Sporomusa malonica]SMC39626.1 VanZ like family protein [Sporomusa malonica]